MAMPFMCSPLLLASGDVERGKEHKNIRNILYYSVFDLSHLYFQYRYMRPDIFFYLASLPARPRQPFLDFLPPIYSLLCSPMIRRKLTSL